MKPLSKETTALFVPSAAEAACKQGAADVVGTGSTQGAEGPVAMQTPSAGTES